MGFTLGFASKVKRLFFSRPVKEKNPDGDESKIVNPKLGVGVKNFGGTKENIFFDTRVWMDSDCEDDYYSVNGEFTPSRGSTPNRHFGPLATPQRNGKSFYEDVFPDDQSEPSSSDKKKLAELLQDSLSEHVGNELNSSDKKLEGIEKPNGINGKADIQDIETNQLLRSSSEGTPKPKKEKSGFASACCMPGLVPGITSRKQKACSSL